MAKRGLLVSLHDLKQLLKQAIPEADTGMRNQLLLHQVINGLPNHISKQLRATGADLDRVMEQAKLFITINKPQRTAAIQMTEIKELKNKSQCLLNKWQHCLLDADNQQWWYVCYRCQWSGHTQRDCPVAKKSYSYGRSGHFARDSVTVGQEMAEGCLGLRKVWQQIFWEKRQCHQLD